MLDTTRTIARWVVDAAGALFVGAVAKLMNADPHVTVALTAMTLIIAIVISESVSRRGAICGLVGCLLILPAGILTQIPLNKHSIPGFQKQNVRQIEEASEQAAQMFRSEFSEKKPDGSPFQLDLPSKNHRVYISVAERIVRLDSYQLGSWRRLELPLKPTPNGSHFVYGKWRDEFGSAVLMLDSAALAGDAKTGKVVSVPAAQVLAHDPR